MFSNLSSLIPLWKQNFRLPRPRHTTKFSSSRLSSTTLTHLTLHWISVDLTHVPASVLLGDRLDVKIPRVDVEVRNAHSWIMRYHVIVNRLNGFGVSLHPANLVVCPGDRI